MEKLSALENLLQYKELLNENYSKDIKELIEAILDYHKSICISELARYGVTEDDYMEMDKRRTTAHNALINKLKIIIRKINQDEDIKGTNIYSYAPDTLNNRVAIADWSIELISEILKKRAK
jgi:hemerythrin